MRLLETSGPGTAYGSGGPALARLCAWTLRQTAAVVHTPAVTIAASRRLPATSASGLFALLPATPTRITPVRPRPAAAMFPHPGQPSRERVALRALRWPPGAA